MHFYVFLMGNMKGQMSRVRLLPVAAALLCGGLMLTASVARASVLTVTNLNDSGLGSLRSAITGASSGDTIQFGVGLSGTILLSSTLPTISTNLTINGGSVVTINGNNSVADFVIANGAVVILDGVTITGGQTASNGDGGGIYNNGGILTLVNSILEGNRATYGGGGNGNGDGGGIYNNGGILTLVNSILEGNTATYGGGNGNGNGNGDGGGIYNNGGMVNLANSTFLNNSASFGNDIYNNGGTVAVTPLPAALPLFATGLGGLGVFGWRRKWKKRRCTRNLNKTPDWISERPPRVGGLSVRAVTKRLADHVAVHESGFGRVSRVPAGPYGDTQLYER